MRKFHVVPIIVLIITIAAYLLGPRYDVQELKPVSSSLDIPIEKLDSYIDSIESWYEIRPDNHAQVVWNDSSRQMTDIAFVYLHGFSASHMEGNPLHYALADYFDANLYLSRLHAHGLKEKDPFLKFNGQDYVKSVSDAIAIGQKLGRKVIVLACSTGATGALYSIAHDQNVDGILLYSPNIDIKNKASSLLTGPWGLQLARLMAGGNYRSWDCPEEAQAYWYDTYRLEALVELKSMIAHAMTDETFKAIEVPLYVAYYYKDQDHQDEVVSIDRMKEMFAKVSTPKEKKVMISFPESGNHGLHNLYFSKDYESVIESSKEFIEDKIL